MALVPEQALLTVTTKGDDVAAAVDELTTRLDGYPDARVVSLTYQVNMWAGFGGKTTMVAVIEYSPGSSTDG